MATLKGESIKVDGLKEFVKELKKLDDKGITDALKDVNFAVAQLVVSSAQGRASTRMESRAAQSLKPSRQAARALVSGGSGIEFFGGAEFGAAQNQARNTSRGTVQGWNQFKPWRGSGQGAGFFLFPAIRSETDRIFDMYGDEVEKIARHAFPE